MILALIFILFIVLLFIFSSSEMSFIASDKLYVKIRARNSKRYKMLYDILLKPKIYLYTILVGYNIANVVLTTIAESVFIKHGSISNSLILSFSVSAVVLLFGEIAPKSIASNYPEKLALGYTPLIRVLYILLFPIIFVSSSVAELLIRIFKKNIYSEEKSHLSATDVEQLILSNVDISTSVEYESKMLRGIFEFSDRNASDAMIQRKEVFFIDANENIENVKAKIKEQKKIYTRYPVYESTEDNVIGIINVNDLAVENPSKVKQILRKVLFVPETLTLDIVLIEMKNNATHMAMVIDEYGGVAGMATFENIIEELIGDISDEYDLDDEAEEIDGKILLSGDEKVREINEEYNLKLPLSDEYETLAGLLMFKLGRIPQEDDIASFKNICKIRVAKVVGFSVKQIELERVNANEK